MYNNKKTKQKRKKMTEPITKVHGLDVDTPDPVVVDDGDYQLTLTSAPRLTDQTPDTEKQYGATGQYIVAYLEFADDPDAAILSHVMMLPHEQSPPREVKMRQVSIRQFCEAFNINFLSDPIDFEEGIGNSAWAVVGKSPAKGEYGESNRVRRWLKKEE